MTVWNGNTAVTNPQQVVVQKTAAKTNPLNLPTINSDSVAQAIATYRAGHELWSTPFHKPLDDGTGAM